MQPIYEVPIIPQNLRREETIIQIAEALDYLNSVSNDIFKRVNERLQANNDQITNIANRLNKANAKLTKLSGAKNATQVFSSSKYPGTDINRQYISLFNSKEVLPMVKYNVKYKNLQPKEEPLEMLQFYHVKVQGKPVKENNNGLGDVPKNIDTVNDLLLYNTGKNPYNNYVISDTLHISQPYKKEDIKDISEIGAAPHSITERTALTNKSVGETYFYTPNLGNVPTINVPLDLPDLPGIADDLRYITDVGPGIAPSVASTPMVTELPVPLIISELPIIVQDDEKESVNTVSNANINLDKLSEDDVSLTNFKDDKLPTISDSKSNKDDNISTKFNKDSSQSSKDDRSSNDSTNQYNNTTKDISRSTISTVSSGESKKKKKSEKSDESRATLMEAIRKAGGSKNAKLKVTGAEVVKTVTSSGDFMADLHAKLTMRRKGISGSKAENGGSAMDKVSAMIPPPPAKLDLSDRSFNTEDDDWED